MISALHGVRVVDLSWVWAGPAAARILADLGADVVKIEAPHRPDSVRALVQDGNQSHADYWDHAGYFIEKNLGKRGVTLDLAAPAGREVLRRLVARSQILIESFSPRVMAQLGLAFETLLDIQPRLIMVSLSGYGASGPRKDRTAYGAALEAESGITSTIGYTGGPPVKSGLAYTDPISGVLAAGAALHALYRQEVGELSTGVHIDLAEREAAVPFVAEQLGSFQLDGERPERIGNRHPTYAPQGCYRCVGNDRWVTVTVRSDAEWERLAKHIGRPDTVGWSLLERRSRHDELDKMLGEHFGHLGDGEAVQQLQSLGIAAARVQDGRDLLHDPHIGSRDFFTIIEDEVVGPKPFFRFLGAKFQKTECRPSGPAPRLDQHSASVLSELGFRDPEIEDMRLQGIWGHRLEPGARANLGLPLELLKEMGAVTEIDPLPVDGGLPHAAAGIRTFEDFLDRALEHFSVADAEAPAFISGQTFREALIRWWGDTVKLTVTDRDTFEWSCPGCGTRIRSAGVPLYTLPMFDYALWEHCDRCSETN